MATTETEHHSPETATEVSAPVNEAWQGHSVGEMALQRKYTYTPILINGPDGFDGHLGEFNRPADAALFVAAADPQTGYAAQRRENARLRQLLTDAIGIMQSVRRTGRVCEVDADNMEYIMTQVALGERQGGD